MATGTQQRQRQAPVKTLSMPGYLLSRAATGGSAQTRAFQRQLTDQRCEDLLRQLVQHKNTIYIYGTQAQRTEGERAYHTLLQRFLQECGFLLDSVNGLKKFFTLWSQVHNLDAMVHFMEVESVLRDLWNECHPDATDREWNRTEIRNIVDRFVTNFQFAGRLDDSWRAASENVPGSWTLETDTGIKRRRTSQPAPLVATPPQQRQQQQKQQPQAG
ncbi:hypothetical protein EBZ80_18015 [bacterium]|nr:hypothetical protein [bacterium]